MVRIGPWSKEDLVWLNEHRDQINNIPKTKEGLLDFIKSERSPINYTPAGYQKAQMVVLALGYGFDIFRPQDFTFFIYDSDVSTEIEIYYNHDTDIILYDYITMDKPYFDEYEEKWLDRVQGRGTPSDEAIDFCKSLCERLAKEGKDDPMSKIGEIVEKWLDRGMAIRITYRH